jgi:Tfp pilus assembly protein PilV
MTRRAQAGSALLEVALAMALMATCGMGLLSAQLSLARHASASATQTRAAFAVDALVESALETNAAARDQWRARASALVQNGQVSVSGSQVVLSWTAPRDEAAPVPDCAIAATTDGGRACVALAFAQ